MPKLRPKNRDTRADTQVIQSDCLRVNQTSKIHRNFTVIQNCPNASKHFQIAQSHQKFCPQILHKLASDYHKFHLHTQSYINLNKFMSLRTNPANAKPLYLSLPLLNLQFISSYLVSRAWQQSIKERTSREMKRISL